MHYKSAPSLVYAQDQFHHLNHFKNQLSSKISDKKNIVNNAINIHNNAIHHEDNEINLLLKRKRDLNTLLQDIQQNDF